VGTNFFYGFNNGGQLTHLPTSFKRPALDATNANKAYNFTNAFNSPSYTLDRHAADIINGGATPNTDRNTFSDNQPGRCTVAANRLVNSPATCVPPTISAVTATPVTLTSGNVLLTVTATGTTSLEYSFSSGATRQSGDTASFSENTGLTILVRDTL
jgi:hypothetical protein